MTSQARGETGVEVLARRVPPSGGGHGEEVGGPRDRRSRRERQPGRRATRGPYGEVRWWERPAPDADERLWGAVQRMQARRLQLRVTVTEPARRSDAAGWGIRRETLSRVLSGKQATTWPTVRRLAQLLGIDLDDEEAPP